MNTEWAIAKLEEYVETLDRYRALVHSHVDAPFPQKEHDAVVDLEPAKEAILKEVDSDLTGRRFDLMYGDSEARDVARKGLALLKSRAEIEENLRPSAPVIRTDRLHAVIWNAASKLWSDRHFGPAVQRAATFLSANVRDLIERHDIQDADLMRQAFSKDEPEPGKSRLRWPGDPSDLTVKSMNEGLRLFAPAVFMTIRNPATHSTDELPEHEALEQLATLSLLAHWIDACDLIEAPKPKRALGQRAPVAP